MTAMTTTERDLAIATKLLARLPEDALDHEKADALSRGMGIPRGDADLLVHTMKAATGETRKAAREPSHATATVARVFLASRGGRTFDRVTPYSMSDATNDAVAFLRDASVSARIMSEYSRAPGVYDASQTSVDVVKRRALWTATSYELTAYLQGRAGEGGPVISMLNANNVLTSLTAMFTGCGLSHERAQVWARHILGKVGLDYSGAARLAEATLDAVLKEVGGLDANYARAVEAYLPQPEPQPKRPMADTSTRGEISRLMTDRGLSWDAAAREVSRRQAGERR